MIHLFSHVNFTIHLFPCCFNQFINFQKWFVHDSFNFTRFIYFHVIFFHMIIYFHVFFFMIQLFPHMMFETWFIHFHKWFVHMIHLISPGSFISTWFFFSVCSISHASFIYIRFILFIYKACSFSSSHIHIMSRVYLYTKNFRAEHVLNHLLFQMFFTHYVITLLR